MYTTIWLQNGFLQDEDNLFWWNLKLELATILTCSDTKTENKLKRQ